MYRWLSTSSPSVDYHAIVTNAQPNADPVRRDQWLADMGISSRLIHYARIDNMPLPYCIQCIRPHVYHKCGGTIETRYRVCEFHNRAPKTTFGISPDDLAALGLEQCDRPLEEAQYSTIRDAQSIERIAAELDGIPFRQWMLRDTPGPMGDTIRNEISQALEKMLEPEHIHALGCFVLGPARAGHLPGNS